MHLVQWSALFSAAGQTSSSPTRSGTKQISLQEANATVILLVGFQVAGHNAIFGILPHLIPVLIGFVLMMIGAASLTGLTAKINCGNPDQTFERCNTMKGLVAVSWIDAVSIERWRRSMRWTRRLDLPGRALASLTAYFSASPPRPSC